MSNDAMSQDKERNHARSYRTWFVVVWLVLLYFIAWYMSLIARLIHVPFWDRKSAIRYYELHEEDPYVYDSTVFSSVNKGYYSFRWIWFFPHVFGAIIWWNLYFLQLIPRIRRTYPWFHRYMGRLLMLTAFAQVVSGVGLAITAETSTIKIVSLVLAVAVTFCIHRAWKHAIARDFAKHKFWVYRLVGYMQTIALQRFYLLLLIITHQMGWTFFYPSADPDTTPKSVINQIVWNMFDDSFTLSILTAVFVTEWFLSGLVGMLEPPAGLTIDQTSPSVSQNTTMNSSDGTHSEKCPLLLQNETTVNI